MISKNDYELFLKNCKFDLAHANVVNTPFYHKPISEFCTEQVNEYNRCKKENEYFRGCCVNFSALLATVKKGYILTTPDYGNAIHCAVVLLDDNKRPFVFDPAHDLSSDKISYGIPLDKYKFKNYDASTYKIYDLNKGEYFLLEALSQRAIPIADFY